jgi:hypothetical protein
VVKKFPLVCRPIPWSDIGDGLRKRPAMSGKVLNVVLPFSVGMVGRWLQDTRPTLRGMGVVAVDVLHPQEYGVCANGAGSGRKALLGRPAGQNDGTVNNIQLCAMVPDAETQCETENIAKPLYRFIDVRIG